VVFPQEGDIFKIDSILRREFQILQFRAAVPQRDDVERVEWWVNGRKIGERSTPFTFSWILRPGSYTIKATARAKEKKLESRPVKISVVT
jgi:penicillin-binding protein 1C